MEASALQAPAALTRQRGSLGTPWLRLRSDDQLVALFRAGHDEAFRVIHDRYRTRLFAYTRQMLPASRQDAEDALQDVFLKAYYGLRASDRDLALRAWLYRVAHNRCVDQIRRPVPVASAAIERAATGPVADPIAAAEQRETLARLIEDIRRLPDQQRSALLMRELSGMSYAELADALGMSVPAVKSVLVRARVSLAAALEARETACAEIRDEIADCHDRGVRPTPTARRHLHDCEGCRDFRHSVRSVSRELHAIAPVVAPLGILAKLGIAGGGAAASGGGGGGAAAGGAAAAGGIAAASGLGAGGAIATGFMTTTAGHVATLIAAAIVTAGGAVEIQPVLSAPAHHRAHHARAVHTVAPAVAASLATPVATPEPTSPASIAERAGVSLPATGTATLTAKRHASALTKEMPTGGTSLTGPLRSDSGAGLTGDPAATGTATGSQATGTAASTATGSGTTDSTLNGSGTGTGTSSGAGSSSTAASASGSGTASSGTTSSGAGTTSSSTSGSSSTSSTSGTSSSSTGSSGSTTSGSTSGSSGTSSGTSSSSSSTSSSPSGPKPGS